MDRMELSFIKGEHNFNSCHHYYCSKDLDYLLLNTDIKIAELPSFFMVWFSLYDSMSSYTCAAEKLIYLERHITSLSYPCLISSNRRLALLWGDVVPNAKSKCRFAEQTMESQLKDESNRRVNDRLQTD